MKVGFELVLAFAASSSVLLFGCDSDSSDQETAEEAKTSSTNPPCPSEAVVHIRMNQIAGMPMGTKQEQCASMDAMIVLHNIASGCEYNDIAFDAVVANSPVQAAKAALGCPGLTDCLFADAVAKRVAEINAWPSSDRNEQCVRLEAFIALNNELDGCEHNGVTFHAATVNSPLSAATLSLRCGCMSLEEIHKQALLVEERVAKIQREVDGCFEQWTGSNEGYRRCLQLICPRFDAEQPTSQVSWYKLLESQFALGCTMENQTLTQTWAQEARSFIGNADRWIESYGCNATHMAVSP